MKSQALEEVMRGGATSTDIPMLKRMNKKLKQRVAVGKKELKWNYFLLVQKG